uniref:Uncharacterized protein n=1 Tax=Tanacetum cinerariifolium TaxID=118510 RepID=A0A6L2LRW1_TANCI|nr:hypothetical protein [Tanacetum cinerariifolium]
MPPSDPNNTYIKPPSEIQILKFIKTLGYDEDPETKMIVVLKMVETRLHQPWRAILSVLNRILTGKDSSWDTSAGYNYYMAKKKESAKDKIVDEPEEKHVSLVKSRRGKGFICYGDQVVNVPTSLKRDFVPRKTRSLTIVKEAVIDMFNEWGQKLKGPAIKDLAVQSLLDLRKGSKASRLESLRQKKQPVTGEGSSAAHKKYYDSSDNDSEATLYSLSLDTIEEYDDDVRYGVFMHNKYTETPNSTYLSLMVTSSSQDFIQTLLDETLANELIDVMSHLVYTDTQKTLVMHNPQGNPKLTSYISGASEVPLGTHVDVLVTKTLLQEMFPDKNAHHLSSLPAKKLPYNATTPQPSSLQAKAKKLMQKAKNTKRKINFKKMLNRIHSNKSNETHTTHQQLYDTLYESITLDQDALYAQAAQSSFHKRSHANQDPPNNREMENKKKRRKDVGEPSFRSSRRNRSLVVIVQEDTPTMKPWIKQTSLSKNIPTKNDFQRSRAKKFKELIQKNELTLADLEGAGLERHVQYNNDVKLGYHVDQLKAAVLSEAKWNSDEDDVSKPRSFERHMSKNTKPHPFFYNNDFYYLVCLSTKEKYTTSITKHYAARYYKQGIEDMISDRWSKETHRYLFEALNGIYHWEDSRIDFFKAEMSTRTEGSVYSDLRIKSVFLHDKLYHLPLELIKDFNNALLLFIKRVVIQNKVEDIQLGVKSYQQTLNLAKPMMFFEGIDQRIPFIMFGTHKGVVYLNQHNIKSFIKLSELKKLCDGTLIKIRENLVDMVKRNKLGTGNKRLKGRDWTDIDIEKSNKMVDKINKVLKRREQLRRLEEYVRGRLKTVNLQLKLFAPTSSNNILPSIKLIKTSAKSSLRILLLICGCWVYLKSSEYEASKSHTVNDGVVLDTCVCGLIMSMYVFMTRGFEGFNRALEEGV